MSDTTNGIWRDGDFIVINGGARVNAHMIVGVSSVFKGDDNNTLNITISTVGNSVVNVGCDKHNYQEKREEIIELIHKIRYPSLWTRIKRFFVGVKVYE